MLLELLMIEDAEASNIQEVFVLKEARAVGVGESMMKFAIDWSRSKGASLVLGRTLPGDRETKNFFEKHRLTARLIEVSKQL
jgi:GNAT superfamily N-acetyltransferase